MMHDKALLSVIIASEDSAIRNAAAVAVVTNTFKRIERASG
jgi:hypothetical protein